MKKTSKYKAGENRRELLKTLAVATGGAALAGFIPGCGDGGSGGGIGGNPADVDAGGTSPDAAGGVSPDAAGGAIPDAAVQDAAGGAIVDAGPADAAPPPPDAPPGEPDLVPLRGDGSHPFHYIDTLIVVQMENRSFDHYFGALSLEEGRADVEGLQPGMSNPDRDGNPVVPAPLGEAGVYAVAPDPDHGHEGSVYQWNNGACDGFVRRHQEVIDGEGGGDQTRAPWIMGYYRRTDLPVHYALADAFTLCDHWYCGLLGPTWPNRYFTHCASSGGLTANNGLCAEPTPYPLVAAAGYSYRVYYTSLYFLLTVTSLTVKNAVKLDKFFEDCAAGTLANVNIVEPSFFQNDDHPPADVRDGQAFLATVYEAVRTSPQWNRCLMIVTYDEHGGFHDHVSPPESQGDAIGGEAFGRLGFRVPSIIIGPLAGRGKMFHNVVDHASLPSLISNLFGVDHVNERSRLAGDIGAALDLTLVQGANRAPPPALEPVLMDEQGVNRALYADMKQPELEALFRKMGMAHHFSLPERRRLMRDYLLNAKRLGAIKLV